MKYYLLRSSENQSERSYFHVRHRLDELLTSDFAFLDFMGRELAEAELLRVICGYEEP